VPGSFFLLFNPVEALVLNKWELNNKCAFVLENSPKFAVFDVSENGSSDVSERRATLITGRVLFTRMCSIPM